MKKSTLLKLAFSMVAILFFVDANAQTNTGATQWAVQTTINDYVQTSATLNKVTVNQPMPFWVWPSALYNPDFDYSKVTALASGATISTGVLSNFAFTYWSDALHSSALATPADYADANQSKNYIEITFNGTLGAGLYDITRYIGVTETPTVTSCPGAAVYSIVQVIDQPMVRFSNPGASELGIANVVAIGCDGDAAILTAATALGITLDNTQENAIGAGASSRYHVNLNYTVSTYDFNGTTGDLESPAVVASPVIKQFGQDGTTAVSTTNPVFATTTTLINGKDYAIESESGTPKATVYEYTLTEWNAGISRKSDYIAYRAAGAGANLGTYSYYTRNIAVTPTLTNRIIVLPKPVTGPIYHIANTWGL